MSCSVTNVYQVHFGNVSFAPVALQVTNLKNLSSWGWPKGLFSLHFVNWVPSVFLAPFCITTFNSVLLRFLIAVEDVSQCWKWLLTSDPSCRHLWTPNTYFTLWLQEQSQVAAWLVLLIFLSRFEEQLHQCLTEDTEPLGDFVGLPLYLPQSLVSTPAITGPLIRSSMSPVQGVRKNVLRT